MIFFLLFFLFQTLHLDCLSPPSFFKSHSFFKPICNKPSFRNVSQGTHLTPDEYTPLLSHPPSHLPPLTSTQQSSFLHLIRSLQEEYEKTVFGLPNCIISLTRAFLHIVILSLYSYPLAIGTFFFYGLLFFADRSSSRLLRQWLKYLFSCLSFLGNPASFSIGLSLSICVGIFVQFWNLCLRKYQYQKWIISPRKRHCIQSFAFGSGSFFVGWMLPSFYIPQEHYQAPPSTPQTCNGYTELCSKNVTDILLIGAHNPCQTSFYWNLQTLPLEEQLQRGSLSLAWELQYSSSQKSIHVMHGPIYLGKFHDYLQIIHQFIIHNPRSLIYLTLDPLDHRLTFPILYQSFNTTSLVPYIYPSTLEIGFEWSPTIGQVLDSGYQLIVLYHQTRPQFCLDGYSYSDCLHNPNFEWWLCQSLTADQTPFVHWCPYGQESSIIGTTRNPVRNSSIELLDFFLWQIDDLYRTKTLESPFSPSVQLKTLASLHANTFGWHASLSILWNLHLMDRIQFFHQNSPQTPLRFLFINHRTFSHAEGIQLCLNLGQCQHLGHPYKELYIFICRLIATSIPFFPRTSCPFHKRKKRSRSFWHLSEEGLSPSSLTKAHPPIHLYSA